MLLLLALIGASVFLTLTNWRLGLPLAIFIGLIQDPIRKMIPGTPAILVLSALPVWALVWLGAFEQAQGWARFRKADPRRVKAMRLFVLSLLPGTLVTFSYGLNAWPVAALGLFAYVAPLLTMVAGFTFSRVSRDIERLLTYYGVTASLVLVGTFLENAGLMPGWAALGTQAFGGDAWIRFTAEGAVFKLNAGFFRSPDIAAWHAATLVMIGLTMAFFSPGAGKSWWLAAVGWGGACLVVTGRRKGIVLPFVWTAFVGASFVRAQRAGLFIRLTVVAAVASAAFYYASGEFGIKAEYYGYAQSTVGEAPQRFVEGTWSGVWETLAESGALGSGIGTATQGGQHLGIRVADTWQESGPTKLAVELGLPGLVGALALVYALARSAAVSLARASSGRRGSLPLGLFAFSIANVACFTISHQIYSDMTVLNLSAFFFGVALSAPSWAAAHQQPATPARQAPLWASAPPATSVRKVPQ